MNTRTIVASILISTLIGFPCVLRAGDQKASHPSVQKDRSSDDVDAYVAQILTYEKRLKKNPADHHVLKLMIQAHDDMLQKQIKNAAMTSPPKDKDDNFPNLPELMPNEPKNWPALRSKPKST